ncbi:transferase [Streptomyces sp. NPDC092370]|uniref:transferase n=1 Tax=Streptomyces sp. NPDC092370 TaxID=3366016 RepID=UPI0037FDF173
MNTPEDRTTRPHEDTVPGIPREGAMGESPSRGAGPGTSPHGTTPDARHEGAMRESPSRGAGPRESTTPRTPKSTAASPAPDTLETQLRADCAIDTDGRITFRLPPIPAAHPRLLLRLRPGKGRPETTPHVLDLEPDRADGRRHAVLEPHPALGEGRWDVYLLPELGAERRRLRPGLRDLRALVDGHLRDRPSPVAVRIPYATKDGFLAIRVWRRAAHAETRTIGVTDRAVTVTARLHGADLHEDATVRLRLRGTDTIRTLHPRIDDDGRGFSFTAGPGELTDEGGPGARIWDVFVRPTSEAAPIRVGRLLDDVADRKHVHVYPALETDRSSLRPYYTVDNDLAIEVT